MSMCPSLKRSPITAPRYGSASCMSVPAWAVTSSNRILSRLRKIELGSAYVRLVNSATLSRTFPRATNRSFKPSLSKSATPLDQPDISKVGRARPLRPVTSIKMPLMSQDGVATPSCDINKDAVAAIMEQGKSLQFCGGVPNVRQAVIVQIAKLSSHPRNGLAVFGISDAGVHRDLFKSSSLEIVEERVRHIVVGDENINEAISIIIVETYSHSFP